MTKKASLSDRRKARHAVEKTEKRAKLGSGKRFAAVEREAKSSGATNPAAVAAAAGRKKYGAKKMAALAAAGKKRHKK